MTEQRNNSSSARRNTSRRSAQAGASQPVASEADALVGRINDRRQQRSQNAVERIRNLIRIGGDLARLKEISKEDHPDWTTDELFREWWHLVQSDESLKEEVLNLTIENVLQDLKSSPHS